MSDWKNNRPENWHTPVPDVSTTEDNYELGYRDGYEAGADALYKAVMKERPSNDEIKTKLIACLYGGSDVPELLEWLKEKLLVK